MGPMRSDSGWLAGFRAAYAEWWPPAAPLLDRHEYATAFKSYPWPSFEKSPWAPARKPLAECRIAVVTTGGLYRAGLDTPFDGKSSEGDWSFRSVPATTPIQTLSIEHPHFAHEPAEADMNTIFPLDRLAELAAGGEIGEVAPTHYSIMGYCTRAADLAETTAPEIAQRLSAGAVDVALIVPV